MATPSTTNAPPPPAEEPLRTYRGNCHCGAFVYEAELPEIKSVFECNCSICHKKGYLWVFPGEGKYRVVKGGDETLTGYTFGPKKLTHKVRAMQGVDTSKLERKPFNGAALGEAYVPPDYKGSTPAEIEGHQLYTGTCHCGQVGVALMSKPLDATFDELMVECNCSVCERNGYRWIYPETSRVVLHAPDAGSIGRYSFARGIISKTFCRACGVPLTNELRELSAADEAALPERTARFYEYAKTHHPVNLRVFPDVDMGVLREPTRNDGANKLEPAPCLLAFHVRILSYRAAVVSQIRSRNPFPHAACHMCEDCTKSIPDATCHTNSAPRGGALQARAVMGPDRRPNAAGNGRLRATVVRAADIYQPSHGGKLIKMEARRPAAGANLLLHSRNTYEQFTTGTIPKRTARTWWQEACLGADRPTTPQPFANRYLTALPPSQAFPPIFQVPPLQILSIFPAVATYRPRATARAPSRRAPPDTDSPASASPVLAMESPVIDLEEPQQGGALQTAKDLFSGAVGGVAQVLIGQPFDIVKVRLQTTNQYSGALQAASSIYRNEGALAFYKGTLTPLIGIGACVSIQFGAFHSARRWFEERNTASGSKRPDLSYGQYFAAGAFAGVSNAVLSTPIEHIRIRLQSQPHGAGRLYAGPLDCVRKLSAHQGVLGGLYRGSAVTVYREAAAYGAWFTAFEYLMNADAARNRVDRKDIPGWKIALYGGLAGEALWLSSYPFDVIKSKMQTDGFGAQQKYPTMRSCFAATWRADGMRGFWKGIWPTLFRAMPVSAGTFAVVEMTMRAIN
ncbi:mitochondrial carnitine/acylcarnitine carrier protein [Purpureocillium lilacinum]|uniref:Mitochondrial carnitine/acylcarnitine carrier protein n=1 Tax=Purpureocillium lilacinum TaxID=33203 RepID=A0A2U3ECI5_PURLI|nr:mitochondrial carnitine/acylcarnitine carrier protein [Purpureocillium lilacinum]